MFNTTLSSLLRLLIITLFILFNLTSCKHQSKYQGYVEGNLTYISSPVSGRLIEKNVDSGYQVKKNDQLFALEKAPESFNMQQALATVKQLEATLIDLTKGQRPSELAAIKAQIESAEAQLEYTKIELNRRRALVKQAGLEQEQLDKAIENINVTKNKVNELKENYITATLGARKDQIIAAAEQLAASQAALLASQWSLSQKIVYAPVEASVFQTYYYVGEQVPAFQPVLALLNPRNIKILFWIPETDLAKFKIGQKVLVGCDSCAELIAKVSFISPSAEFTPPVIYSHEVRTKLRYRIEARLSLEDRTKMHPGQPVDILANF